MEDYVGAKFYCPHTLPQGNQCIQIREKTLELSSYIISPDHAISVPTVYEPYGPLPQHVAINK